jgi:hypothetical protein
MDIVTRSGFRRRGTPTLEYGVLSLLLARRGLVDIFHDRPGERH